MNHSLYSADRSTHLKIVTVALIAAVSDPELRLSPCDRRGMDSRMHNRTFRSSKPASR